MKRRKLCIFTYEPIGIITVSMQENECCGVGSWNFGVDTLGWLLCHCLGVKNLTSVFSVMNNNKSKDFVRGGSFKCELRKRWGSECRKVTWLVSRGKIKIRQLAKSFLPVGRFLRQYLCTTILLDNLGNDQNCLYLELDANEFPELEEIRLLGSSLSAEREMLEKPPRQEKAHTGKLNLEVLPPLRIRKELQIANHL
jgi:hypothetical protein